MNHINNVIIFTIDALRADRIGAMGCSKDLTPNIDLLAKDGIVFEDAYCCINATDPSTTSLHTGRVPRTTVLHHGDLVTQEEKQRVESIPVLPELLSAAGLETVATGQPLGRWHKRGFDRFPNDINLGPKDTILRKIFQFLGDFDINLPKFEEINYEYLRNRYKTTAEDEFINLNIDAPFYGYIHTTDTHVPYVPKLETVSYLLKEYDYPEDDDIPDKQRKNNVDFLGNNLAQALARYDGAVKEADERVGKLMDHLKERGLWDTTALIILSDHGETLNEHGMIFDHHTLYEESIHIPLIMHIPGVSSSHVSKFVQTVDIFPTVLELLDIDYEGVVDGQSLVPLINNGNWSERGEIVVEEAHAQRRSAIQTKKWKYIEHTDDEVLENRRGSSLECGYCGTLHGKSKELYYLESPAGESDNILEENPDMADSLQDKLYQYFSGLEYPPLSDFEDFEDEEELFERLEHLGYK